MQVEHLDVSRRVDLMDGVSRRSARLPVQVVALYEHRVVAQTAQPHVTLALHVQLHALADVQSGGGGYFVTQCQLVLTLWDFYRSRLS